MVEILEYKVQGKRGYDVRINSDKATVYDYLQKLQNWSEQGHWYHSRNPGISNCTGCAYCCQERIPLTIIDIYNLAKVEQEGSLGYEAKNQSSQHTIYRLVKRWSYVWVEGPVVDIVLRRTPEGHCVFLDPGTFRCRIYPLRPLVCQSYFCCSSSRRAMRLREAIVNKGEDELVRQWLLELIQMGIDIKNEPPLNEAERAAICLEDWPTTCFADCQDYGQVRIKELCEPDLWKELCK